MKAFFDKVDKTDGCWEWTAYKNKKGYGQFFFNNAIIGAHRVSLILAGQTIPSGCHVLHQCNNPSCVNPEHLYIGTNDDNVADKMRENRQWRPIGEKHHKTKLINQDILRIRDMHRCGARQVDIASWFNVTKTVIWHIIHRKTWTSVL